MDILTPDVRVAKLSPRLIDKTGRFNSPLSGAVRSVTRPGDRWGFRVDYSALQGVDRARIESLIAKQRGAANRILYSPNDYPLRGSFPAGELLVNNGFLQGVSGWSALGPVTLSAPDRVMRLTATASGTQIGFYQNTPVVANAPYVLRSMIVDGAQSAALGVGPELHDGALFSSTISSTKGMLNTVLTPNNTNANSYPLLFSSSTGYTAGTYLSVPWCSLTRCALVDNGPNYAKWSDDVSNAVYILGGTTLDALVQGPDGTNSARNIKETSAFSNHFVAQSCTVPAVTGDVCLGWCLAPTRPYTFFQITDVGSSVDVFFDSATGAVASFSHTGATWSNWRAFSLSLGGGWWAFYLIARKATTGTTLVAYGGSSTGIGIFDYAGSTAISMRYGRMALALSSVPMRLTPTAASANPTGTAQGGAVLCLKGLPANTPSLLALGDWFEVNKELKRATAALNSDPAGLGYLEFSPPMRTPPADGDPLIVNTPMGRFIFSGSENGWASVPGIQSDSSLDLVEAA